MLQELRSRQPELSRCSETSCLRGQSSFSLDPITPVTLTRSSEWTPPMDFREWVRRSPIEFKRSPGFRQTSWHRALPSLAEAIAGEPIRGSWWGHPKGRLIYSATQAICESPEVLVCKLIKGKVT